MIGRVHASSSRDIISIGRELAARPDCIRVPRNVFCREQMGDKLAGRTRKVLACLGQGLEVSELVRTSRAEYSIVAASLIVAITVAATV
jgi:hypothetical protein